MRDLETNNNAYFTDEIETSHINSVNSWERVSPVSSDKGEFSPLDPLHQLGADDQRTPLETAPMGGKDGASPKPHNPPNRIRSEFWLSADQKHELKKQAEIERVSVSEFIRKQLFNQKYKVTKKKIDHDLLQVLTFKNEINGLRGILSLGLIKSENLYNKELREEISETLEKTRKVIEEFSYFIHIKSGDS